MEQKEEQNKNPVTSTQAEEPKKEKQPLTEAQRQKRNKLIVYPLMGLMFIGSMWWIFAPSEEDKQKELQSQGFNTEMPLADGTEIIGDKTKAYELGELEARQQSRERAMQDLGDMFKGEDENDSEEDDYSLMNPGGTEEKKTETPKVQRTVQSSANAYRDLNTTLGSFYEQPERNDEEVDELKERIAMLEAQLESGQNTNSAMDEQMALMEKSYELAARYMGGQNGQNGQNGQVQAVATPKPTVRATSDKAMATPVKQVHEQVVSALSQPMTNEEFVATHSQERNYGFHTAVGKATVTDKNTISACVYGNQTITDGQAVKLRLLEPMAVDDMIIPRNAVVVGAGRIQGERLGIAITSLEYEGTIIPVELMVYDSDGQEGIFIPNSMELNAVKEVAANMGGSLGSSINISTDAGAQLASDLGKGVIQGTSQYIAKKMRTVKVHLKSGYKVMLYQERD